MDLHPERIGHRLDSVEADTGLAPRLVPLDLPLLQPEAARQLLLTQPSRDPGADQRLRRLIERGPPALEAEYPTLLDLPAPVLRMYPVETVIAEWFEAIVRLALANTRLKDFYDLWSVAQTRSVDGATLVEALTNTFLRRCTLVPTSLPTGLSPEFFESAAKQRQWTGFLRRVAPARPSVELCLVAERLAHFLMPPAIVAATGGTPPGRWDPDLG